MRYYNVRGGYWEADAGIGGIDLNGHTDKRCAIVIGLGVLLQRFERDPRVGLEYQRECGVPLGDGQGNVVGVT